MVDTHGSESHGKIDGLGGTSFDDALRGTMVNLGEEIVMGISLFKG